MPSKLKTEPKNMMSRIPAGPSVLFPIRLPRYKGGRKGFGSAPQAANAMLKFRYVSFLFL